MPLLKWSAGATGKQLSLSDVQLYCCAVQLLACSWQQLQVFTDAPQLQGLNHSLHALPYSCGQSP